MKIIAKTGAPLHAQIRQILMAEIDAGAWRPGTTIPSETTLAQRFGVSRMTVRQALGDLARLGLLDRHRGRPTRIAQSPLEQSLVHFYTFPSEMGQRGLPHSSRVVKVGLALPQETARVALDLDVEQEVAQIVLLRLIGDTPVMIEEANFPAEHLALFHHAEIVAHSLYDLLAEQTGIAVTRAIERIHPIALSRRQAQLLQTQPLAPAFQVERTSYAAGQAIEWRKSILRGDHSHFVIELHREQLAAWGDEEER